MGFENICDGEHDNVKNYEQAESTEKQATLRHRHRCRCGALLAWGIW